ncbi:hypothetical protein C4J81_14510 [Deltaproteobacteria bacterium Smac51]|nr:hypothetical protein C4J81_14510 [Deltaproteobacteria bacterium Smac51]
MNKVSFITMARVAVRSLFLEASWNNMWQQNLGMAAAIDPALRAIYGPGEELKAARMRALGFFNTNPIASGLAIGVAIRLEQNVAEGSVSPAERERILLSLSSGALAPLGDNLFWFSWLPFCSLAGVWAVLSLESWWAPLILPVLFCLLALPSRFYGLRIGYRYGDEVTDLLDRVNIEQVARNIKRTVAVMIGASTVILLYTRSGLMALSTIHMWLLMLAVVVFVMLFRLMSIKTRILNYWYPFVLVGLGTAAAIVLELAKLGLD